MAKENPSLKANNRTITGKKVKQMRKEGLLPATVYGQGMKPVSIQIDEKEMEAIFSHVGESGLVDLVVDEEKYPILFRNPQYHPVSGNMVHIDCYQVNLKKKIVTTVPIELVGESEAVRAGNVLVEVTNEIEVEALPADLPEKIEVDLAKLIDLESMVTVADLVVDKSKVEIKNAVDQVIVKVEEPKIEEELPAEEAVVEPGEVPATEQKSPDEAEENKKEEEKK